MWGVGGVEACGVRCEVRRGGRLRLRRCHLCSFLGASHGHLVRHVPLRRVVLPRAWLKHGRLEHLLHPWRAEGGEALLVREELEEERDPQVRDRQVGE